MVIETDKTSATWTDLAATAETQHQVERGLLLDVVVSQGAAVFELLTREDQTLLIRRNSYRNKTNERASSSSVTHSRFLFVSHPSPRVNLTNTPWAPRLARAPPRLLGQRENPRPNPPLRARTPHLHAFARPRSLTDHPSRLSNPTARALPRIPPPPRPDLPPRASRHTDSKSTHPPCLESSP